MTAVMQGVRVLEVAEHTFVPAASALLAEWGAEVTCDVFLTNKMPTVRTKLKIDLADIRAHNPDIIYVRGHGQGHHGPDADKGSYDSLAYWNRSGIAYAYKQPDEVEAISPPGPGFGDSIGAMTIAGGIMGALFHRANTGEATEVDVSLLGVGMWSMGAAIALSLQHQAPWTGMGKGNLGGNPLTGNYETKDRRQIALTCLQPGKYWAEAVANDYIQDYETADGFAFRLASPPIRFGDEAPAALRAPEFNEHGDAILESIGLDMEAIIDLKVKGVVV